MNGITVASGATSASIALPVGDTAICIVETAEDGSTTETYIVTVTISSGVSSLELIDLTPGIEDGFGTLVVPLANGNIVVSDPFDSTFANNSGAVHLYSPFSSTPIASIYGDAVSDQLGSTGEQIGAPIVGVTLDSFNRIAVTKPVSGNYYILRHPYADNRGLLDSGMVQIVEP